MLHSMSQHTCCYAQRDLLLVISPYLGPGVLWQSDRHTGLWQLARCHQYILLEPCTDAACTWIPSKVQSTVRIEAAGSTAL